MLDLFNNLDNYSKFYFTIAIISTVVFLLKLLLMFVGGDSGLDGHINDLDPNFEHDTSFTFLSTQSILAFLMCTGWIGLAAKAEWKLDGLLSVVAASVSGFLAMFLMAFLMTQVKKLNKNVKTDIKSCVGTTGKAYTKFFPRGSGQIQITLNGKLQTIDAINNTDEEIASFTQIIVTGIDNSTVLIASHKQEK